MPKERASERSCSGRPARQFGEDAFDGFRCQSPDLSRGFVLYGMGDAGATHGGLTKHLRLPSSRFTERIGVYEQGGSASGLEVGDVTQTA